LFIYAVNLTVKCYKQIKITGFRGNILKNPGDGGMFCHPPVGKSAYLQDFAQILRKSPVSPFSML
jgi:hypothetical protein